MHLGYIDPGSGSLIFSAIVASILAVPYFLRSQIGRVVGRIRGRAPEPTAPEPRTRTDEPSA